MGMIIPYYFILFPNMWGKNMFQTTNQFVMVCSYNGHDKLCVHTAASRPVAVPSSGAVPTSRQVTDIEVVEVVILQPRDPLIHILRPAPATNEKDTRTAPCGALQGDPERETHMALLGERDE